MTASEVRRLAILDGVQQLLDKEQLPPEEQMEAIATALNWRFVGRVVVRWERASDDVVEVAPR